MTWTGTVWPAWLAFKVTPVDWFLLGAAVLICTGMRATSTEILLTSERREQGRVLSCVYFTGTRATERQYMRAAGEGDFACPRVKSG